MINTHNGIREKGIKRIEIDDYPAIKKHLDEHLFDLQKRVDKGDTLYNLRNCAYMDDFFRPKIIYPNMTKYLPFVYDSQHFLTNQKCFIITGESISYLTVFLNSSLFKYCYRDNFPELLGGTRELSKIFFDKISVRKPTDEIEEKCQFLIAQIQKDIEQNKENKNVEIELDKLIFDYHKITESEQNEIGFIKIV